MTKATGRESLPANSAVPRLGDVPAAITCCGEMLVEIMRADVGVPHSVPGVYKGPYPSGAPCIFIDSAARMGNPKGVSSGFVGVVGDDDFGRVITTKLQIDGVDVSKVRVDPDSTTGMAFVQYNEDGSRKFIFSAGAAGKLAPADIDPGLFKGSRAFHVMGSALSISEGSRHATMKALGLVVEGGGIASFDPNLRPEMMPLDEILDICGPVIKKTTVLLPSGEEAAMLTGDDVPVVACEALLAMGPEVVVLKEGSRGCTVFDKDGQFHVDGFPVKEVDPTGAGDTFGGAFMVEYLLGTPLKEAALLANAAGAMKVTSFGPMASDTRAEVEAFVATRLASDNPSG